MEELTTKIDEQSKKKRIRRTKEQIAADKAKTEAMGIEPKQTKVYKKRIKSIEATNANGATQLQIIPHSNSNFIIQKDIPNLVDGKYRTNVRNYVWFIDETELKFENEMKVWFLIAVEGSSRLITISNVQIQKHNSKDVITSLEFAIKTHGKPDILHTDKGGCFISRETQEFLFNQKIKISNATTFGNQVAESNNRVFKEQFFSYLEAINLNKKNTPNIDLPKLKDITDFVTTVVNASPAQDLIGKSSTFNSRELINTALYFFPSSTRLLAFNNTENAELIQQFLNQSRYKLFQNYFQLKINQMLFVAEKEVEAAKEKMEKAILQADKNHFEILYTLQKNNFTSLQMHAQSSSFVIEGLINIMDAFNNQSAINQKQMVHSNKKIDELQKQVDFLHQQAAKIADAEAQAELRKQKVAQRIKQPLRGPILDPEFQVIIKHCKTASDRVYCTLLYLTGMRISNLAELTFGDLEQIKMAKNHVHFRVIKNKIGKISCIYMNPSTRQIIKTIREDIDIMLEDAKKSHKYKDSKTSIVLIHLKSLNRRINQILRPVSEELNVNLKSHSFRIGIAWRVTDRFGIEVTKQMLNHADIKTTQHYIANELPHQVASQYINEVFDTQFKINPETANQSLEQAKELFDSWNDFDITGTRTVANLMSIDDEMEEIIPNNKNESFEKNASGINKNSELIAPTLDIEATNVKDAVDEEKNKELATLK